jgi:hypothetical protein
MVPEVLPPMAEVPLEEAPLEEAPLEEALLVVRLHLTGKLGMGHIIGIMILLLPTIGDQN